MSSTIHQWILCPKCISILKSFSQKCESWQNLCISIRPNSQILGHSFSDSCFGERIHWWIVRDIFSGIVKLFVHFNLWSFLWKWTKTDTKVTFHPPPTMKLFLVSYERYGQINTFYSGAMALILPQLKDIINFALYISSLSTLCSISFFTLFLFSLLSLHS